MLSTPLHKGANMKFYVMSDLHGFYTLAIKALTDAGFYDDQSSKKLILLGDCFDRGNEARAMESWLLKLLDDPDAILIKGNHEDLFEDLLLKDFGQPRSHHVSNGTYDTALQLTGFDLGMAQVARTTFVKTAMATPYYKTIIPAMRDYYETEHYIFVHGYLPEQRDWYNADAQEWRDAGWINGMAASQLYHPDKTVVCGHWHASWGHAKIEKSAPEFGPGADFTPYFGEHVIGIDACTAYSKFVNCLVLEDNEKQ